MSGANKTLFRSHDQRMVAGVCGGLGEFFGIDPTIVRLLFVFGIIFGHGILLIVYLVLFMVVPEEPAEVQPSGAAIEPTADQPIS